MTVLGLRKAKTMHPGYTDAAAGVHRSRLLYGNGGRSLLSSRYRRCGHSAYPFPRQIPISDGYK